VVSARNFHIAIVIAIGSSLAGVKPRTSNNITFKIAFRALLTMVRRRQGHRCFSAAQKVVAGSSRQMMRADKMSVYEARAEVADAHLKRRE
jgi:hypothetical protein